MSTKNIILTFGVIVLLLASSGCGILHTLFANQDEMGMVKAELELEEYLPGRVLVLVDQPSWVNCEANLRSMLTEDINFRLKEKFKLKDLVEYGEIARLRAENPEFYKMSPYQVGRMVNADVVIVVGIDNYALYEIADAGYYSGSLVSRCSAFDVQENIKIWPRGSGTRRVGLCVEVEKGSKKTLERLSKGSAHCVVRYFQDCKNEKFNIIDEEIDFRKIDW